MPRKSRRRRIRKSKGFIKVRRTRRHHSGGDGTGEIKEKFNEKLDRVKEAAREKFYELKTSGTKFFENFNTKLSNLFNTRT